MKALKFSVSTVMIIFLIFSCNKDDEIDIDDSRITEDRIPGKIFQGEFTLKIEERYNGGNAEGIKLRSQLVGNGDLDLMSEATLVLDHHTFVPNDHRDKELKDGTFRIWNDSGAEIYGNYDSTFDHGDKLEILATINGGYGSFLGVRGILRIELLSLSNREFQAVVRGTLFHNGPAA